MEWPVELLKHLKISRSAVGALLLTAATLYFGPRYYPDYVDPVPKEWAFVVVAALVFSASLFLFWGSALVWSTLTGTADRATTYLNSRSLSSRESEVLTAMAANPTETVNLDNIDYRNLHVSKLEMMEVMRSLHSKGLVRVNEYDETLSSLTPAGRKRALEITRAKSASAA